MLLARVMSNNVVTFCFLGDVTLICEVVEAEFSMANVDSRSSMSNVNSPAISPHTVVGKVGAFSLFQKNGFRRLFDFGILGAAMRHPDGGGGGGGVGRRRGRVLVRAAAENTAKDGGKDDGGSYGDTNPEPFPAGCLWAGGCETRGLVGVVGHGGGAGLVQGK